MINLVFPATSTPGTRSRPNQTKPLVPTPKRLSRVQVKAKVPEPAKSSPVTTVFKGKRHIPERLNSEGKSINKRPKISLDESGQSQDEELKSEGSRQSLNTDESLDEKKSEDIKRHSRAKKSFPNKPPQMVPLVSLQRPTEEAIKPPPKTEGNYEMPTIDSGPLSSMMRRGADSLAKQMSIIIEETIKQAAQGKGAAADQAAICDLKRELERVKWQHKQEISELKSLSGKYSGYFRE